MKNIQIVYCVTKKGGHIVNPLMQFWKNKSFSLKLTNTIIGSDVKINKDSIHGYMGLGFDMSNFNEDGSDDVYTFGISMPIRMVQYCDSFTWSKYSRH
jgi:hypothetical protein